LPPGRRRRTRHHWCEAIRKEIRTNVQTRIKFKLPFFGEAEAEGLAGIIALVIMVALHWTG
jgi:hypothetical protein